MRIELVGRITAQHGDRKIEFLTSIQADDQGNRKGGYTLRGPVGFGVATFDTWVEVLAYVDQLEQEMQKDAEKVGWN